MNNYTTIPKKTPGIIFFAIIASVLLYLAGVFSGLYANKIIKEKTEQDIQVLKEETLQDFEDIQTYVNFLNTNLENMQLEQTFMETLSQEEMCNFSKISLNELFKQLNFYWKRLPFRPEEYEKNKGD